MKFTTLIFLVLLITAVVMTCAGCKSLSKGDVCCPVCEDCSEGVEDPYMCSQYYADKANPQLQTGSFDFFLEEEDKITSSLIATKCQTCGIHFTHPSYGEHIKTCCP